jgi:hypothetical protein
MQVVEAAVEAHAVARALLGAMIAEPADGTVDRFIVSHDRAAIAERAQVLLDDEAGAYSVAQLADLESVAARADGLGVVLDDQQIVLVGNFADGAHVGALAVEMDGHQRFRFGSDGRLDARGIDAVGLRVGVDEHGRGVGDPDSLGGGEESVRLRDAFVPGADAKCHERQPQSIGAVAYAYRILQPMIIRELLFKPLEHRSHHVLTAFQNLLDIGVDLGFDVVILLDVAVKGHIHGGDSLDQMNAIY